jgi:hypothetical protein
MGSSCACQKIDNEEEFINVILSTMSLSEVESKSAYSEFLKCYNKDDGFIDYFQFKTYLTKIIGDGMYKNYQYNYFENIRRLDKDTQNLKILGIIIIYLSKGTNYSKMNLLAQHYLQFYKYCEERVIKEFIRDCINCHTDHCLNAFRDMFDYDTLHKMNEFWKKMRKTNLLNEIFRNFSSTKKKYNNESYPEYNLKMNNTEGFEKESLVEMNTQDNSKTQGDFYVKNRVEFIDEKVKLRKEEIIIREFIDLSFTQLSGEYVRTYLYEDYLKEKN